MPKRVLDAVDSFVDAVIKRLTAEISDFVAFLFIWFAVGTVYGIIIITKFSELALPLLLLPLVIGLIAHESRGFAMAVFLIVAVIVIII